jgi:hypothetical protein
MANPHVERLRDHLWPKGRDEEDVRVYALVDAAHSPQILPLMKADRLLHHDCLYAGSLPLDLARVAPYLVLLDRDLRFTETLLDRGWGKNWAVYLTTSALPDELRRHFRRFLRVWDERGKALLFRFYDPRVLREYLPTCNVEELQTVFGPVGRFLTEALQPSRLIDFRRNGTGLEQVEVDLGTIPRQATA